MAYYFNGQKRYFAYHNGKLVRILGLASKQKQLVAPTISLDGDTLTITAGDEKTETFAIFVDGVEMATVDNTISFTISHSDGSGNISDTQVLTAPSGMTWGEWVNYTAYTINGVSPTIENGHIYVLYGDIYRLQDGATYSTSNAIGVDEVIKANATYYFGTKSK